VGAGEGVVKRVEFGAQDAAFAVAIAAVASQARQWGVASGAVDLADGTVAYQARQWRSGVWSPGPGGWHRHESADLRFHCIDIDVIKNLYIYIYIYIYIYTYIYIYICLFLSCIWVYGCLEGCGGVNVYVCVFNGLNLLTFDANTLAAGCFNSYFSRMILFPSMLIIPWVL
jgi:hypothetical protein